MKTHITHLIISAFIGMLCIQPSFGDSAASDKFTQADMKVALQLKNLHYYYLAVDKRVSEGQKREDAMMEFSSAIGSIERELDKTVGFGNVVTYLDQELKNLRAKGFGAKHPQILWIERLLKGLRPKIKN